MAVNQSGRPSLFDGKTHKLNVRRVTPVTKNSMDAARKDMSNITKWPEQSITDVDVVEFIVRGRKASIAYWKETGKIK